MTRFKLFKQSALVLALGAGVGFNATPLYAAPGLVDVYQMSLLHDATLAQARANYDAEREVMTQARSVLLPNISASGSVRHPDISESASSQAVEIELNQTLFNREAFSRYDQAKSKMENTEVTYRLAQQSLIVRVSTAYFDVLLAEQNLGLAKSKLEADKILWEKAKASSEVGLASRTDVLQARSAYDLTNSNLISAENELDIAYEKLSKLTGQSVPQVKQLVLDIQIEQPRLDKTALELKAEADNLTVRIAQLQQAVAAEEVEAQKSGHWFNLNLRATHTNTNCNGFTNPGACNDGSNTGVSIVASIPLYSGGLTSSRVTEARFKSQAAMIGVRDAREQARLDARVQTRNLERGFALVAALREAVKSGEAFLEAAEEGYRVGLRNMIDVVTAQANLFDAQSNLAAALHNLLLTQLHLQNTLGDLNVDHLRQLDQLLTNP